MPVLPNFLIFSVTPRFTCTAWAVLLLRHFAVLARWPSGEANCQTTATFAVVYWYDLGAVSALKPDVSILEIGTNDLVANRPNLRSMMWFSCCNNLILYGSSVFARRYLVFERCSSPCRAGCILIGALVAPVCLELEPLLLWFYFIWDPCCSYMS